MVRTRRRSWLTMLLASLALGSWAGVDAPGPAHAGLSIPADPAVVWVDGESGVLPWEPLAGLTPWPAALRGRTVVVSVREAGSPAQVGRIEKMLSRVHRAYTGSQVVLLPDGDLSGEARTRLQALTLRREAVGQRVVVGAPEPVSPVAAPEPLPEPEEAIPAKPSIDIEHLDTELMVYGALGIGFVILVSLRRTTDRYA